MPNICTFAGSFVTDNEIDKYAKLKNIYGNIESKRIVAENSADASDNLLLLDVDEFTLSINNFTHFLPGVTPFYAVKANNNELLLSILADNGWNYDAASAQELIALQRLHVTGDRIILANPIKNDETIQAMLDCQVSAYTFDSETELVRISDSIKKQNPAHIPYGLCRIQVCSTNVQTDLNKKFGCAPDDAIYLISRAVELGLPVKGIAFHVGTQSFDIANYENAFKTALTLIDRLRDEKNIRLTHIDMGGGFPVNITSADGLCGLDTFYDALGKLCGHIRAKGFTLFAEPGRAIAATSGINISTIIGKTRRNGKLWYHLSDGVYGIYNGVLFDHQSFRFYPVQKNHYEPYQNIVECVICGPTCDSIDVIAESAYLPDSLNIGDKLFTPNIGAYSLVATTNFNGFAKAEIKIVGKY